MNGPRVHALIPAAGRSVRFGGTTVKQYAHLLEQPVIAHSISAVCNNERVRSVTVALAEDDGIFAELVAPQFPKVGTVIGGDSRARSVLNGLQHIHATDPDCAWVLVHDAARPCLAPESLRELMDAGLQSDSGAILAVPVSDTLKRADAEGRIETTLDRAQCWSAQTPQLFPLGLLLANLADALQRDEIPTDEAAAMERAGYRPLLVRGSRTNIKITGPEDLALAEFILRRQSLACR